MRFARILQLFLDAMPASYRIYAGVKLVHTLSTGDLSGPEMLAHAAALRDDPSFSSDFAQLADFRQATRITATHLEMQALARWNPFAPTARRVGLVGALEFYGMLRMYQLLTDTADTQTLVTMQEDEAWSFLGISPDALCEHVVSEWSSEAGDAPASGAA